ncbi:hypothetical protein J2T55_002275 [Methylohalomonas lacus]|uniref:DUF4404 family protein n=1 Tax=Methylohalomonas lacus TaxID=398773 RepID=A0AAE3L1L5_9GAMM|nr:DUF4404 family protein [Methylohalomonas lacus]MCS3904239.1 hypothetical protein [Methylohalomonas lacus]
MSEDKLRQELERLKEEAAKLPSDDAAGRARLDEVIKRVESKLAEDQDDDDEGLFDQLQESVSHFEAEHPRATAILNDIMVTLSNMGI